MQEKQVAHGADDEEALEEGVGDRLHQHFQCRLFGGWVRCERFKLVSWLHEWEAFFYWFTSERVLIREY